MTIDDQIWTILRDVKDGDRVTPVEKRVQDLGLPRLKAIQRMGRALEWYPHLCIEKLGGDQNNRRVFRVEAVEGHSRPSGNLRTVMSFKNPIAHINGRLFQANDRGEVEEFLPRQLLDVFDTHPDAMAFFFHGGSVIDHYGPNPGPILKKLGDTAVHLEAASRLAGDPSVERLLRHVQAELLAALDREDNRKARPTPGPALEDWVGYLRAARLLGEDRNVDALIDCVIHQFQAFRP